VAPMWRRPGWAASGYWAGVQGPGPSYTGLSGAPTGVRLFGLERSQGVKG